MNYKVDEQAHYHYPRHIDSGFAPRLPAVAVLRRPVPPPGNGLLGGAPAPPTPPGHMPAPRPAAAAMEAQPAEVLLFMQVISCPSPFEVCPL
jgi:hypothetical protein